MPRLATILLVLCSLLLPLVAQERFAAVEMLDGAKYSGAVLAMDLEVLKLQVGDKVVELPTARVRTFRSTTGAGAEPAENGANPRVSWTGPLPDPVDPEAALVVPHDLRRGSLLRARIDALDLVYPWLAPAAPSQWLSLGLLLFVSLGLVVHLSARVAGADAAEGGRSFALGVWYLVTGLAQVALVPANDLSIALMLLANTSVSLFLLRVLFGLPRGGAIIALMVQLGFAVVVYGVLELVTAVLGSVGAAAVA